MGIKEKRFDETVERILKSELQKGNLPSSHEFLGRLNYELDQHPLSQPLYDFHSVRPQQQASSTMYNADLDNIYKDLYLLYENTKELHDLLNQKLNKFEVGKNKLMYEVRALEQRLKELALIYSQAGILNSVYDVFDDANKIDQSKSDAFIDIKQHEVSISNAWNTSTRITPNTNVRFSIADEIKEHVKQERLSGYPSYILEDGRNEFWQERVVSSIKEEVVSYLLLSFESKQRINRVECEMLSPKETYMRVEFTPDGLNWFKLPYHENGEFVMDATSFDFPTIEATAVRIVLSKKIPDLEDVPGKTKDEMLQHYVFGLKQIRFYQLSFAESATMQTKPLEVQALPNQNFTINQVSLEVDDFVPHGSNLEYFIALPPAEGEIEWKRISPRNDKTPKYEQIIDFKNIMNAPPTILSVRKDISISEHELPELRANGISFYKIGSIKHKGIIENTERLYMGKNAWGVKYFAGQYPDHKDHIPSIEDWNRTLDTVAYDYVPMQDGKPSLLMDKTIQKEARSYMYTLGVFCEEQTTEVRSIPASTEPIAIYINGKELFKGVPSESTVLTYVFENGWNEMVVLAYTRNIQNSNGSTINVGFDPREVGSYVYSRAETMKKVSLFDLRYNVKNTDITKYALLEKEDEIYVITNHAIPGLEYEFFFNQIEGDIKDKILFKAEFSRDRAKTDISPKLKRYRILFS